MHYARMLDIVTLLQSKSKTTRYIKILKTQIFTLNILAKQSTVNEDLGSLNDFSSPDCILTRLNILFIELQRILILIFNTLSLSIYIIFKRQIF
jgi:hypothetical protein